MTSEETVSRLEEIRKSYVDLASLEYRVGIAFKTVLYPFFSGESSSQECSKADREKGGAGAGGEEVGEAPQAGRARGRLS